MHFIGKNADTDTVTQSCISAVENLAHLLLQHIQRLLFVEQLRFLPDEDELVLGYGCPSLQFHIAHVHEGVAEPKTLKWHAQNHTILLACTPVATHSEFHPYKIAPSPSRPHNQWFDPPF